MTSVNRDQSFHFRILIQIIISSLEGFSNTLFITNGLHSKKMLGWFNPILGQIWTNSNVWLKMQFIWNVRLGFSIFDPNLG